MRTERLTASLLLAVAIASAPSRQARAAGCDPTGVDLGPMATARAAADESCDCAAATSHKDYLRCVNQSLRARVASGALKQTCMLQLLGCARNSSCGRPGAVTCCETGSGGNTRCRVRVKASQCLAPPGGTACVSLHQSCCDACTGSTCAPPSCGPSCLARVKTVFVIVGENANWDEVIGSASAPYMNGTLLPIASYATQYFNAPGIHPSEPNYLWLEAGTNFGILNDKTPAVNHQSSTAHLVTLLENAGITWKSYQEDIPGTDCPLVATGGYVPRHNPMVFFDDVTNTNDPNAARCIAHVRPYTELATDLTNNTVARYNFITPDVCDDGHDLCAPLNDNVAQFDTWLSTEVPKILASQAYQDNGLLLITWDEADFINGGGDGPIGLIALSPLGKGGGYNNSIHYTHSSTLRTLQEVFGMTPFLGDAANAVDLGDLFRPAP